MHSVDTKQDHKPRVLVAMSGGRSIRLLLRALLQDAGYGVAGVTMKLWGGPSDTGCCSVVRRRRCTVGGRWVRYRASRV